ncbi:hypothetical protein BOTNAR_0201g00020 [Botryotinia narcissicola]|uniref:Uncharacterized protein n=1 Tax=Botryotinia narcissicola TaxID=278944 RepID=A0A4Z1I733_9HELO|nr:hypothetical protein BOTNAR_0201g00020 [Botryotinia narcissicola]
MGMTLVFSGVFAFLVDEDLLYAASALAANSFARSSFTAAFPLFGVQSKQLSGFFYYSLTDKQPTIFNKPGYQWATALLALLSLAMTPFP